MSEIQIQTAFYDSLWCGDIDQTIIISLNFMRQLFTLLAGGRLRLRRSGGLRFCRFFNSRPRLSRSIDTQAFTVNFYDRDTRSLFVKGDIYFLLRGFLDHQLAKHVFVSTAAHNRAAELKFAYLIGSKLQIDRFLRRDFLINAKGFKLEPVIDVDRSDDEPDGLSLLHCDRPRIELELFSGDSDFNRLLRIILSIGRCAKQCKQRR